jgi:hypothetical protein
MMDLGLGEKGALDELNGYQTKLGFYKLIFGLSSAGSSQPLL